MQYSDCFKELPISWLTEEKNPLTFQVRLELIRLLCPRINIQALWDFSGLPLDDLKQETETAAYPLQSDLKEAAQAILRIHFIYSLSASDVRSSC